MRAEEGHALRRVLELFGRRDIAFSNASILGEMNAIADETTADAVLA
jgi:hypothetical protein